jgi:hypothetical protein
MVRENVSDKRQSLPMDTNLSSKQKAPNQPLPSRAGLRSRQKLSKTSILETLQQLREEARY